MKRRARSVSLKNFTGKIRQNPDGSVSIAGIGKRKKNASRRRRRAVEKRVGKALRKYVRGNRSRRRR